MLKFKEWLKLKEDGCCGGAAPSSPYATGTTTGNVAAFPRPLLFSIRGDGTYSLEDKKHKKHSKKK